MRKILDHYGGGKDLRGSSRHNPGGFQYGIDPGGKTNGKALV